jgi:hypothetical protein
MAARRHDLQVPSTEAHEHGRADQRREEGAEVAVDQRARQRIVQRDTEAVQHRRNGLFDKSETAGEKLQPDRDRAGDHSQEYLSEGEYEAAPVHAARRRNSARMRVNPSAARPG